MKFRCLINGQKLVATDSGKGQFLFQTNVYIADEELLITTTTCFGCARDLNFVPVSLFH